MVDDISLVALKAQGYGVEKSLEIQKGEKPVKALRFEGPNVERPKFRASEIRKLPRIVPSNLRCFLKLFFFRRITKIPSGVVREKKSTRQVLPEHFA
jgi:hypothetical protein